jgi:hypothetical protein
LARQYGHWVMGISYAAYDKVSTNRFSAKIDRLELIFHVYYVVCAKFYSGYFDMNIFFWKYIFFRKNDNLSRKMVKSGVFWPANSLKATKKSDLFFLWKFSRTCLGYYVQKYWLGLATRKKNFWNFFCWIIFKYFENLHQKKFAVFSGNLKNSKKKIYKFFSKIFEIFKLPKTPAKFFF